MACSSLPDALEGCGLASKDDWNYLEYLTIAEAGQIRQQFQKAQDAPGKLVLWTDMPHEWAQDWADAHNMQTLTTMMGCLMDKNHPSCLRAKKSKKEWQRYIKGASGLFADLARRNGTVTVLTSPPGVSPHRLCSTYKSLEEPIVKGDFGGPKASQINYVHPMVVGAECFEYQAWPTDKSLEWIRVYGQNSKLKHLCKNFKTKHNEVNCSKKRFVKTPPQKLGEDTVSNGITMSPLATEPMTRNELSKEKQSPPLRSFQAPSHWKPMEKVVKQPRELEKERGKL